MDNHNQEDRFYSNMQQNSQYQQQQGEHHKKKHQGVVILLVVVASIFMVFTAVCGMFAFRKMLPKFSFSYDITLDKSDEDKEKEKENDVIPFEEPVPLPDDSVGEGLEGDELEDWEKNLKKYSEKDNPFMDKDYISHMGTDHTNHPRSEFKGKYYEQICDSITTNVGYTVSRDYYAYSSKESNTQIHVSCVSLKGDVANIEALNKAIYDKTMFLAKVYLENYKEYSSTEGIDILVDSYVTYNDESTISIVLDEYYRIEEDVNIDLFCINADLDTGMILNNAKILRFDERFAREFKEKSTRQNGDSTALDDMSEYDILYLLEDEYNNIIFYTPMGMELGINYVMNGASGWITVTYPDYQQYINSL